MGILEIKNTTTKIKKYISLSSIEVMEEKLSELEGRSIKIIQLAKQKKK
jgi:hypothetical protein